MQVFLSVYFLNNLEMIHITNIWIIFSGTISKILICCLRSLSLHTCSLHLLNYLRLWILSMIHLNISTLNSMYCFWHETCWNFASRDSSIRVVGISGTGWNIAGNTWLKDNILVMILMIFFIDFFDLFYE